MFHDMGLRTDDIWPIVGYGNTTSSLEAGVKYHMTEHVGAFLALRSWRYHGVWGGGTWEGSELDLKSEGLTVGMEFSF